MQGSVFMDSTPVGHFPNEVMEFDLVGTVVREGRVEYGFAGMIGYHHNLTGYFRDALGKGKITLAFNVYRPKEALALHRLFTLVGKTVKTVFVKARRDDGTLSVRLELQQVLIDSVRPVAVSNGMLFLVVYHTRPGSGTVAS